MTKHKDTKDQAGGSRPGPSFSPRNSKSMALLAVALVAAMVIGFLLGRLRQPQAPPPSQNATLEQAQKRLDDGSSAVDKAIAETLKTLHLELAPGAQIVEPREHQGLKYSLRTLRLPQTERKPLNDRLVKELAALAPQTKLTRTSPEAWDIAVDGVTTHKLIPGPEPTKAEPPIKEPRARLAIVIDDMGEDVGIARELAALGVPIVFSIWPDSGHREEVLKIAKAAGREILIHLPMQPKGYPAVDPGPRSILVSMKADEITAAVKRASARVHGAIGVNNHMGSAFTESNLGMRVALQAIHDEGLFFLDSRTTAATVCVPEAKRLGVRVYQRDVFIDNDQSVAAIKSQLRKGEALARERGHAIVIGHPHRHTVDALRQWLKEKDKSVSVAPLTAFAPL